VLLVSLFVTALVVLHGARADAQVNPLWDHYKVYEVVPPPLQIGGGLVTLTDQFGTYDHQMLQLLRFMNPVEKQVIGDGTYGIHDDITHYAWWSISPQTFSATVTATNQFGDQTLNVHDGVYLLNPALKNQPLTNILQLYKNHYKCYLCDGQPINKQVILTDQFGQWSATVTFPRYFCNPVDKHVLSPFPEEDWPILDPNQHYICYELQPEDPTPHTATVVDQFIRLMGFSDPPSMDFHPSRYLCVPTLKTGVTGTARDTWGRVKMLYR